jgi:ribonuclease P protein component
LTTARNSFTKSHRLLKPSDFQYVFQRARKWSTNGLTLYARPNALGYPRLGIAISRKCSRSAVVRNRIRRIIRESFRLCRHELGGVDLVFLGRAGMERIDRRQLRDMVERNLSELRRCDGR